MAIARQTPRVTEPLYARPEVLRVPNPVSDVARMPYASMYGHMQSSVQAAVDTRFADVQLTTDTPVDIQLVDVQQALQRQIAEEKAQDRISQPFSLLPNAEIPVPVADVQPRTIASPALSARGATRSIWHDRLLFILIALLVLGIMGGLSFGYLLSLAHLASAPLLRASLSLVSQVVQL